MHSDNPVMECGRCYSKYANKGKSHLAIKKAQACEEPAPKWLATIAFGDMIIKTKRCIGNYYNYQLEEYISLIDAYNKGFAPYSGPYLDWPLKFVELIKLIENLKAKKEREAIDARRNSNNRDRRGDQKGREKPEPHSRRVQETRQRDEAN